MARRKRYIGSCGGSVCRAGQFSCKGEGAAVLAMAKGGGRRGRKRCVWYGMVERFCGVSCAALCSGCLCKYVTKVNEIESARKTVEEMVGDKGLNLLINNAGVARWQPFAEVTTENMLFHLTANAVGPVMVFQAMLPLLSKAAAQKSGGMHVSRAAVLNISSVAGSVSELTQESPKEWLGVMSYRVSKAALNMAMRVAAVTVEDQGILVTCMCPGWVRTDMGTELGLMEPSESISAMMMTLSQMNESHHGAFLDRYGKTISF
ncbi:c-factor [Nephila pilipes]|uniref:C-factor n=1 Tax=Nephila pilipes TaxID=299642 RepID=A0A8X6MUK9_NEPPI|nr:c-factor [Nephila pilipes]